VILGLEWFLKQYAVASEAGLLFTLLSDDTQWKSFAAKVR
jgi:hypothetical protein